LRVGELLAAQDGAEVREYEKRKSDPDVEWNISDQIYKLCAVVEETASFERACSLAGALFQVGLARAAAVTLFDNIPENIPSENKDVAKTFDKLIRLLESVDHPTAFRAYAWSSPIEGSDKRRFFAVLHQGPVKSPGGCGAGSYRGRIQGCGKMNRFLPSLFALLLFGC
jgi:hypothetical protein